MKRTTDISKTPQNTQASKPLTKGQKFRKFFDRYTIITFLLILGIVFVANPIRVSGSSMEKSFHNNNIVLMWKLNYYPERNDVIIFKLEESKKYLIKRVIGLPGDEIVFADNSIYVNGVQIDEPYLNEENWHTGRQEIIVPENQVFVLGDNRNRSADSRSFGTIEISTIKGKVVSVLL